MAQMGGSAMPAGTIDSRLLVGQVIGGKYRVSHLLGEGGMASVWAGTNERTGKLVALKVIRQSFMATPGAEVFLQSEGLAASRVNHPNVVTVFDVIEHDGMACIVMEFLDGMPLGTYISCNGQLTLRDTMSLLLPAMRGVAAAHAQGVIHRDLKPQNIFVCVDPDGRIVTTKVLDFGISMMMDWARGKSVAAMPGLVGTPAYMAPEHIEGSTDLDPRTDVYGFGLLLYETLSGRPAFPGEPSLELLRQVLSDAPVPLRERRPDLPPGVVAIVETAMAKRPEQRFESLSEMLATIEEQMMQLPAGAGGSTPGPSLPMSYTLSAPLAVAVPTHVGKEPSEQHQATQIYGQPQWRESEPAVPNAEMAKEASRGLLSRARTPTPVAQALGAGSVVPGEQPASSAAVAAGSIGSTAGSAAPTELLPTGARAVVRSVLDSMAARVVVVRRWRRWRAASVVLRRLREPRVLRVLLPGGIGLVVLVVTLLAVRSSRSVVPASRISVPAAKAPRPARALVVPIPSDAQENKSQAVSVDALSAAPSPAPGRGQFAPRGSTPRLHAASDGIPTAKTAGETGRPVRGGPSRSKTATGRGHADSQATPRAGTLTIDDF